MTILRREVSSASLLSPAWMLSFSQFLLSSISQIISSMYLWQAYWPHTGLVYSAFVLASWNCPKLGHSWCQSLELTAQICHTQALDDITFRIFNKNCSIAFNLYPIVVLSEGALPIPIYRWCVVSASKLPVDQYLCLHSHFRFGLAGRLRAEPIPAQPCS